MHNMNNGMLCLQCYYVISMLKVYYQLYEKPGVNGGSGISSSSVDTWSAVLDRAKAEVKLILRNRRLSGL